MAEKKVKVKIDVDSNIEPTIANLKLLKKQLKETAAGSAEFNQISAQIRDMDDAIKDASKTSDDFAGMLENASGPLGVLGKGIRGAETAFSSFNGALKMSIIGILVTAIGGLVAAFTKSEVAMKKLEPIFIAFEQILGGIFRAFEPVLDVFLEMATSALPYITKGIGMFYSGLFSLFTLVKNVGVSVGKILKGVFTLDFDALKEGAAGIKDAFTGVAKTFDATYKRFEAGTKEQTKIEKENLAERNKNAEDAAKKREEREAKEREAAQKAFDEKVRRMEAEDKLDEARLKKLKQEGLALAETEQQKLDVEKKFAELSYNARIKDLDDKMALYDKDSVEYKNLQTEKTSAEAEYISERSGFADKQKKINEDNIKAEEENVKARKEFQQKILEIMTASNQDELERQKQERQNKLAKDLSDLEADKQFILLSEEEKNRLRKALKETAENDITNIEITAEQQRLDKKLRLLELNGQALLRGTASFYDNRRSLINELEEKELLELKSQFDKKKLSREEFERAQTDIQKKYAQQRKDVNTLELNDYLGYATQILGAVNNIFSQASNVAKMQQEQDLKRVKGNAEEEEKVKKNAFEQNKKFQIAQAIIGTLQGAVQAYQSLAVIPVVGPALGAVAAAAALVFGYKQVALIKQQTYESASAGGVVGASAASGASPTAPTVSGTSAPEIQSGAGVNPSTQIAQSINKAQAPLRAYVVSGEVSSQQALDRRTSVAATFNG
jgi:hypothetical protein